MKVKFSDIKDKLLITVKEKMKKGYLAIDEPSDLYEKQNFVLLEGFLKLSIIDEITNSALFPRFPHHLC